ncbi:MAG: hypothetical protein Q4A37_02000 [Candidatus Saccharibacteria bacterium]|nr:hypothetical protein [Candidatus Saccharibacteria bacterium]
MKLIVTFCTGIIIAVAISLAPMTAAAAFEGGAPGGVNAARGTGVPTNLANGDGSLIQTIINVMLYAIGVISVIMLIIGGFRYVVSGGQKESVTAAKNTILYAIVGLLVALFAYAIVHFILQMVIGRGGTDV